MRSSSYGAALTVDPRLAEKRSVWAAKPVLRLVYEDLYQRLLRCCRPGRTLEVGGGTGNLRDLVGDVVCLDILACPWIDVVADAHRLPFADKSFDNVVMVDVLHHLANPLGFFAEAARVLSDGGRLVMIEPAITPASWPFYKMLHHEPVDFSASPFAPLAAPGQPLDPLMDSNQAIPTMMFGNGFAEAELRLPLLRGLTVQWLSLAAYPLSGGFRPWALVSERVARALLRLEARLESRLGRIAGFRMLVALERRPG